MTNKTYTVIITSEDERYGNEKQLSFFAENPWEGKLETVLFTEGTNDLDEVAKFEGLFYQLYDSMSGNRIGYGVIDPDYPRTDIEEYEKTKNTHTEEANPAGRLIILSGFSGAGKNAIASGLMELSDQYTYSVSATTRVPRPGEKNEIDYFFITRDLFEKMESEKAFLETGEYCGEKYGTIKKHVTDKLKEGRDVILILEYTGAMHVKELYPDAVSFFIAAPAEELKNRLYKRNPDPETVNKRLAQAEKEAASIPGFDYLIMNKNGMLDKNIQLIHGIMKGKKVEIAASQSLSEQIFRDISTLCKETSGENEEQEFHAGDIVICYLWELERTNPQKYIYRIVDILSVDNEKYVVLVHSVLKKQFLLSYKEFCKKVDHTIFPDIKQEYSFVKIQ